MSQEKAKQPEYGTELKLAAVRRVCSTHVCPRI